MSAAAMLAFLMCAACLLVPAKGENGPCDTGDWAFAYISVGNDGDSSNPQGEYKTIYSANSKDISTVEGISYDRASNTLTIENYNNTKNRIAMNMMGDDFKINIKGENHIGELTSYGDGWGGSITLTGNGTLYINENKSYEMGIYMNAENTKSVITVGPECSVYVYSGRNAIVSSSNTTSDIIKAESKISTQLQTEVTHPVKMTMIFAGYFSDTLEPWEGNVYTKEGDSAKYDCLKSTKSDGTVTYCYYELKKYDGFDKGYIGVKKEELSEKSSDYKMTDEIVKWYSADSLSGSTSALVKDTKTGEEAYAVVSKYENSKGYLCKIIANFGIDEYNQETCLVDIDNPVADIANPNEYYVKLPDGYEAVGGYDTWTHGEAVAAGMCRTLRWQIANGYGGTDVLARLEPLLTRYGLPTAIDCDEAALRRCVGHDKKTAGGTVQLVIVRCMGQGELVTVPLSDLWEDKA